MDNPNELAHFHKNEEVLAERERLAIIKAAEQFDDWQDCTCDDPDEWYCWYRLSDVEQMDMRVASIVDRLETPAELVRPILEEGRARINAYGGG